MALKQLKNFIPNVVTSLSNLLLEKEDFHNSLYLLIKSIGPFSIQLSDNRYKFEAEIINSCSPRKAYNFNDSKNLGLFINAFSFYFYKNSFKKKEFLKFLSYFNYFF